MAQEAVLLVNNVDNKNYMGIKSVEDQKKWSFFTWLFPSKRSPYISKSLSQRTAVLQDVYGELEKAYKQEGAAHKDSLGKVLTAFNQGFEYPLDALDTLPAADRAAFINAYPEAKRIDSFPADPKHPSTKEINAIAQNSSHKEDMRVFAEFERTLFHAQPSGLVPKVRGVNPDLADLINRTSLIFGDAPEKNPLLYDFPNGESPHDFLSKGLDVSTSRGRREAVKRYLKRIDRVIQHIIDLSPQDLGMTFEEDNVKHIALVRELKLSRNRLGEKIDAKKRWAHVSDNSSIVDDITIKVLNRHDQDLPTKNLSRVQRIKNYFQGVEDLGDARAGVIYLYQGGEYSFLNPNGYVQRGSVSDLVGVADVNEIANNSDLKQALIDAVAKDGHTLLGEKKKEYKRVDRRAYTESQHKARDNKIYMRLKKKVAWWFAAVFAVVISIGQAAIAALTFVGGMAIVVAAACGFTNIPLFLVSLLSLFTSILKGEIFKGLSLAAKILLGFWLVVSLVVAIGTSAMVLVALVTALGYTLANAPFIAFLGASIVALVTLVGMTAMGFVQVGVRLAHALRGQTLKTLAKNMWEGLKGFFRTPELNTETKELKEQVKAYQVTLKYIEDTGQNIDADELKAMKADFYALRGHLRRELFAHKSRHGFKLIFTLFFVPAALVAAVVATYAFSVLTASSTTETLKVVLGWSDKLSTVVSNIFTWGFNAVVNGGLSVTFLVTVSIGFAASFGRVTSGILYAGASIVNLTYHGHLLQSIKNGWTAFWAYPRKNLSSAFSLGITVAIAVPIVLNGWGNGSTAGAGAISARYVPTWILNRVSAETLTIILATASSMAMNQASIDELRQAESPVLRLKNPFTEEVAPEQDLPVAENAPAALQQEIQENAGAPAQVVAVENQQDPEAEELVAPVVEAVEEPELVPENVVIPNEVQQNPSPVVVAPEKASTSTTSAFFDRTIRPKHYEAAKKWDEAIRMALEAAKEADKARQNAVFALNSDDESTVTDEMSFASRDSDEVSLETFGSCATEAGPVHKGTGFGSEVAVYN